MASIELKNLNKVFDKDNTVIEDLNLSVRDGEFLVLVGPSGCGKSTTLRMIAGLEEATAGEIFIGNKQVNNMPPKDRDIAMVFQNYALYPHMTVYDNMAFGLKLRKMPKDEIDKRVAETAEILEISDLLKRKPKQLSGGQRQRVALGRAIVRKPKVFLFDEPLSNLDAKLRVQMRAEIKKLHQHLKTTMVYVTHDQTEAMTMGDRIVVMKTGRIHQVDTPMQVYRQPADNFVAGFIGSPAMNFIPGIVHKDIFKTEDDGIILPLRKSRFNGIEIKSVVLGIRPEDIHLCKSSDQFQPVTLMLEVIEPLGNESILYLSSGRNQVVCRTQETEISTEITSTMTVFTDMERVHFFDMSTGVAI
ncbi:sn-glycerol-3-phosphate ABC transporter ATP-binding protein UgpC [bacterium]|nr:sn-glycerol-3-phosphate ABC transporter ATP-binding protein UgpC [bacterium]MBU1064689.1 sn-glycerol-3-phosphate ABC transporter ATP-binding protein UgpC [bacterium]MBU1635466.1 sn-glycerol-3-phosphate ABC transporter ATP-binding protein UgpC [bacterium]MBU1874016.1 sn-glycerol-3-phosphate ABC transporter ATP-binding protein UgpC [bacterium]